MLKVYIYIYYILYKVCTPYFLYFSFCIYQIFVFVIFCVVFENENGY